MPKRPSTVISEQSERMPFSLNQSIQTDLYDLFVSMQKSTYPPEKRYHLACPFWKFHPREYRHVRNSNCLFWGFRDIGELNEHIQRRHCKGKQSKSDKGDHVPVMNSKQEAKWRQGNWKKAGSTESKWWKIAKAVTGYSMPEEDRPDDFHFHFPGPDIYLIQRFESFRRTGSEDNSSSQEDERPDTDISVFARSSRSHTRSSNTNWTSSNPRSSDPLSSYIEEEEGEGDDEPTGLFSDPFNPRPQPSRWCITRGSDSAYHSYEDQQFGDSTTVFWNQGQSYVNDGQLGGDYAGAAGLVHEFLVTPEMQDLGGDMFGLQNYPPNLDEEDFN